MTEKINENIIFELQPEKIAVHQDLPRQRKDLGKIEEMMDSIKTFGQLQPIVINRNNELIAGGRRLAACTLLGIKAKVCYIDTIDPVLMRELELEENIQRKSLTPAEECFAIDELVQLKQKKYGKPTQGRAGGYTLEDAADSIGKSKGNVIEAIQMADMLREFPDLSNAKSKSEIKKAYKGLQRISENIIALESFQEKLKTEKSFSLLNEPAETYLPKIPKKSIDLLFTDPPYGIDITKNAMTIGGQTGGSLTTTGITYNDSKEEAMTLYTTLAFESYKFCKDTAHIYIFLAPSHFHAVRNIFTSVGWLCAERPVIWIKGNSGQNNQPDKWFSSAYEMILFARKPTSQITLQGKPDWIQCDIVHSGQKIHQAEKPVSLCKELISRVSTPGNILCDPFAGSGAIIEAALEMKLIAYGCEKSLESYANAIARLNKWKENNKNAGI